jgi:signal transduction histidine kinase/CheY-like chemotaxis protein
MARTKPVARRLTKAPFLELPRELAAKVETLAELPEAVFLTRDRWQDGGVDIVWANPSCVKLTGFDLEHLIGRNTCLLHGVKSGRAPVHRSEAGEGWLQRRNGTAFYASWKFSPIRAAGRRSGYLLALYQDLSETHRLREALLHSQKLDTVGQLASGVAHDFNNLLSVINGYCEIMSGKLEPTHAAQKDLQEMHRAGLKAAGIARQILEFSRRQETEPRVVNANTLIREIADILRRIVGDAVQVQLRLAADLGNIRIDPTQFQQALLNLSFNARDAMPQGGRLTIRTSRTTNEDAASTPPISQVVVEITDTGVGIPAALRRRIFEPFFTTKPHGTGLGLPTVIDLVKRAGGQLKVRSKPGVGSTFEMVFWETAEAEQLFSPSTLTALPATIGTEVIWLVEADLVLRKMVSGILAADGYSMDEFAQPAETPADTAPDLLMVDCRASLASELAKRILARNPKLRVLSLSADAPVAGFQDFPPNTVGHLPKPFALSTLLRAVRQLLDAPGR